MKSGTSLQPELSAMPRRKRPGKSRKFKPLFPVGYWPFPESWRSETLSPWLHAAYWTRRMASFDGLMASPQWGALRHRTPANDEDDLPTIFSRHRGFRYPSWLRSHPALMALLAAEVDDPPKSS
jgi:hypothetical protein